MSHSCCSRSTTASNKEFEHEKPRECRWTDSGSRVLNAAWPDPLQQRDLSIGYHRVEAHKRFVPRPCGIPDRVHPKSGDPQIYVVLRKGKWDIPGYLGDGSQFNVDLAYLVMEASAGPAFSLNHAYPFVKTATVAFGFPDIIFKAPDAFQQLLDRRRRTRADVVLGLFPAEETAQDDRIIIDRAGKVVRLHSANQAPTILIHGA